MKKSFLLLIIALFFAVQGELISSTVSGISWYGNTKLVRNEVNVTVHNTHLEIEEEAELSPIVNYTGTTPPVDQQFNLKIAGRFTLPKNAVLTGAIMWDGDNIVKAQLKFGHNADMQFDSITTINSRGDAGLKGDETASLQLALERRGTPTDSLDHYKIAIGQVRWKANKRIKLHYIVPLRYQKTILQMDIPHIFGNICSEIPNDYTLNLLNTEQIDEVKLFRNDKTITHTLPATIIDNFIDPPFTIRKIGIDQQGIITKSTFPTTGENILNGEFMHLWTQIPDSLFLAAGLKREVVFLWRWENENSLVNWRKDQDKFLTVYGDKAVRQAKDIKYAALRLMYSKAGVGMFHDRTEDGTDTTFRMAYKNSAEAETLIHYLDYLIEDDGANLYAMIAGAEITNEDTDPLNDDEVDSISVDGKDDFEIAIDTVLNLFSKDEKLIKHVVVISAGKRKTDKKKFYINSLKAGFEEITVSGYGIDQEFPNGYWPGVDLDKIVEDHKLINGENYNGFNLPRSKAATFTLTIKSEDKNVVQNILGDKQEDKTVFYDNVYFSGHAAKVWKDTLLWKAQDEKGNTLASFTQVPIVETVSADTAIAMLWGGSSSSPYSEVYGSESIGFALGFVDDYFSLLGHSGDTLSSDKQKAIEDGGDIEYIQIDEKHPDNDNILFNNNTIAKIGLNNIQTTLNKTVFFINIGDHGNANLIIYDLRGRLIMEFNKEMLVGKSSVTWDGTMLNGSKASTGMYLAVATIGNKVQTIKFVR